MTVEVDHDDIRPGDEVTILLHLDGWTRTSTVNEDGSYTGCGAVVKGHAEIVRVRRWTVSLDDPPYGVFGEGSQLEGTDGVGAAVEGGA